MSTVRKFESGATRSSDEGKLDYCGYLCPVVLKQYAEYMQKNETLPDGSRRRSDDWKQGIPTDSYMRSLMRHVMDLWLHHEGHRHLSREPIEDALCAIMFNAMGYLREVLLQE